MKLLQILLLWKLLAPLGGKVCGCLLPAIPCRNARLISIGQFLRTSLPKFSPTGNSYWNFCMSMGLVSVCLWGLFQSSPPPYISDSKFLLGLRLETPSMSTLGLIWKPLTPWLRYPSSAVNCPPSYIHISTALSLLWYGRNVCFSKAGAQLKAFEQCNVFQNAPISMQLYVQILTTMA